MRGQDSAELAHENDGGLLIPVVLNLSAAAAAVPSSRASLSDELLQTTVAAYGTGAAQALAATPQVTAAQALALSELYFDAITVFMLRSGPVQ